MKKSLVIGIVVVIIAGVGFFVTMSGDSSKEPASNTGASDTSQNSAQPTQPSSADDAKQPKGDYIDYSDSAIADANGDIFLFFHAPWCPQCRSVESGIVSDGVPQGVTVIKVDYDTNQELRQKYGVTLQTSFVKVDSEGNNLGKFVAYNEPFFSSVVRDFISK